MAYLYQIFYRRNKFDSSLHLLNALRPMMWDGVLFPIEPDVETILDKVRDSIEEIDRIETPPPPESASPDTPIIDITTVQPVNIERTISPDKPDTLFWCAYIAHYGYADYMSIQRQYHNREIAEKQKVIQFLIDDPTAIRCPERKTTKTQIQLIMAELMVNKKTSYLAFRAICAFYRLRILIVNGPMYMSFGSGSGEIHIFHMKKTTRGRQTTEIYSMVDRPATSDEVDECKTKVLVIDPEKPMRGVSAYKKEDLEELAECLGVDVPDKCKKGDLYQLLNAQMCSAWPMLSI